MSLLVSLLIALSFGSVRPADVVGGSPTIVSAAQPAPSGSVVVRPHDVFGGPGM